MDIEYLKNMFRYKYQADDFAIKYQDYDIEMKQSKKECIERNSIFIILFIIIFIYAIFNKYYSISIIIMLFNILICFQSKLYIKTENQILYITKDFRKYKIDFSDIVMVRKKHIEYTTEPSESSFIAHNVEQENLEIYYKKNIITKKITIKLKHNSHTSLGKDAFSYDFNIENIDKLLNFFLTKDDILFCRKECSSNYISIENKDDYYEGEFNGVDNVIGKKEEENCDEFILKDEKYYLCDIIKKTDYNNYKNNISKDFDLSKIMFLQSKMLGKNYLKVFVQENEIISNKEKLKGKKAINETERIERIALIAMGIFLLIMCCIIPIICYLGVLINQLLYK